MAASQLCGCCGESEREWMPGNRVKDGGVVERGRSVGVRPRNYTVVEHCYGTSGGNVDGRSTHAPLPKPESLEDTRNGWDSRLRRIIRRWIPRDFVSSARGPC